MANGAAKYKFGKAEKAVAYGKKRKEAPPHVFLLPKERKFPVKVYRNGKWVYSKKLLKAALGRARQHGYLSAAAKAERILQRKFGYKKVNGLRAPDTKVSSKVV